jgi:hypothetical protein
MKRTGFLSLFLCLCLLLAACGSSAPMEAGDEFYRNEAQMDASPNEVPSKTPGALSSDSALSVSPAQSDRKLIKTVTMDVETEYYNDLLSALEEKITALGGYTENRQTGSYGRTRSWCSMTIRIPAENLSGFVAHVAENANVLSTSEETVDVTLQYSDTEAKIAALELERSRLMELLADAGNLSEILEIEARLSDVTYELERYESHKRGYDNQITYATVHLRIEEVEVLTPMEEPTVWVRIRDGFKDSLEGVTNGIVDVFVYLIAGSPFIVVYGTVLALLLLLLRKLSRKAQKKKQSPPSETP